MPRVHLGNSRRAGSSTREALSRRSSSSSGSKDNSNGGPPASLADGWHSDDQFGFEDDVGEGDRSESNNNNGFGGSSPMAAAASPKTQRLSSLPPKQNRQQRRRKKALYDSSDYASSTESSSPSMASSSDAKPTPNRRNATTAKKRQKPATKSKRTAAVRMKPTVTSPTITLKSLSEKTHVNTSKKKKQAPAGKKHPIGKPIQRFSSGATNKNGENAEKRQHLQQKTGKRTKAPSSARNKQHALSTKNAKKNTGRAVASSSPLSSGEASYDYTTRKKKRAGISNEGNTKFVDCLVDTDDEKGADEGDDYGENEILIVNARKETAKHHKKKEEKLCARFRGVRDERRQPTQVLPLRGLVIDNRAINTVAGESLARHSFLKYISTFLEGGLASGVLISHTAAAADDSGNTATVVASLVHRAIFLQEEEVAVRGKKSGDRDSVSGGMDKGRVAESAQVAVLPRVSYLFESKEPSPVTATLKEKRAVWLAELLTPIRPNASLSISNSSNCNPGRVPCGFTASDSWTYFADLGKSVLKCLEKKFEYGSHKEEIICWVQLKQSTTSYPALLIISIRMKLFAFAQLLCSLRMQASSRTFNQRLIFTSSKNSGNAFIRNIFAHPLVYHLKQRIWSHQ